MSKKTRTQRSRTGLEAPELEAAGLDAGERFAGGVSVWSSRAVSARGHLEPAADVRAGQWTAVSGAGDQGVECRELAQARARPDGVEVVGVRRHVRFGLPAPHRRDVEAVADERESVRRAPQADQPGSVAGQIDDLQPGDVVALGSLGAPVEIGQAVRG